MHIDWEMVDSHMEGLRVLSSKRRKITLSIEFICKEVRMWAFFFRERREQLEFYEKTLFWNPWGLPMAADFRAPLC